MCAVRRLTHSPPYVARFGEDAPLTMAQRKLGRGLGALVTLSPAAADGTARIDEVTRTSPETSVLSLSGRSVEDFFRVMTVEDIVAVRAAAAAEDAGPAPETDPMSAPDTPEDDAARRSEPTLFDPVIEDETVPVVPDAVAARLSGVPAAAPLPEPPRPVPPAPEDVSAADDDIVFLDEQVGGLVLPDVEME